MHELVYEYIDKLIDIREIYLSKAISVFVMLVLISLLAIGVFYLTRLITNKVLCKIFRHTNNEYLHIIARDHCLPLLAHLAMAGVFWGGSGFVIRHEYMYTSYLAIVMIKVSQLYLFLSIIILIMRLIQAVNILYEAKFSHIHGGSISSYLNVAIFCVWAIGAILIVSFFSNQSPLVVLTGIGAVSAVFLLVFKDILLGIVASIQATALNIVHVGDRVSLDKYNIDGTILSIAVSTVKIRNNDNTIITIPTYMITSEILKNWRGLSDFGARRIKRAIYVDINSIKDCSSELKLKLTQIINSLSLSEANMLGKTTCLNENNYDNVITKVGDEITENNSTKSIINLNLYRCYIEKYLQQHREISRDYSILVRHLAPTPNGLPLEIHAFTHCVVWDDYERIQADIFEHCLAMLPVFELRVLQKPA